MDRKSLLGKLKELRANRFIFLYSDFPCDVPSFDAIDKGVETPEGFVRVGEIDGEINIVPDKAGLETQKFLGYIAAGVFTCKFDKNPFQSFGSYGYETHISLGEGPTYVIHHSSSFLEEEAKKVQESGERFSLSEINN